MNVVTQDSSSGRTAVPRDVGSRRRPQSTIEVDRWQSTIGGRHDRGERSRCMSARRVGAGRRAPGVQAGRRRCRRARCPARCSKVAFEQRLNEQLPLDLPFKDEDGRDGAARRVLRPQAGGAGVRVLRVPDAVHAGAERPRRARCACSTSRSARTSTSSRSASIRARRRCWRRRRRRRTSSATSAPSAEQRLALPDRRRRRRSTALTEAAGFNYVWDEATQQFAHASGIVVVTPDGKLSRYFFGIEYSPRDLKFALIESSNEQDRHAGRSGCCSTAITTIRRRGNYGFVAMNAVRLGGAVTLAGAGRFRGRARSGAIDARPDTELMTIFGIPHLSRAGLDVRARTSTRCISSSSRSCAFFALAVAVAVDRTSASSTAARHDGEIGARIEGNLPLELLWSVIPIDHRDGDVRLGRVGLLPPARVRPTRRCRSTPSASSGCGSSSTSTASARSTSCTCRSGRPVKVTSPPRT